MNNAINHFLYSLGKNHARGSIGIVLSGNGSDGAEGIKFLKDQAVLSPEEIAQELASISDEELAPGQTASKVIWFSDVPQDQSLQTIQHAP